MLCDVNLYLVPFFTVNSSTLLPSASIQLSPKLFSLKVLLEHLPNVLILQLKRFIYDKDGGLQKVMKKVNFPIDLEITKGEFILLCNTLINY